jgi:arylsulfatase A-like enzyme
MRAIVVWSLALVLALVATARGEYRIVTQRLVDWETSRPDATAPRTCAIGDEIRPAAGCPSPVFLGIENGVEAPAGRVQRAFGVPPGGDERPLLLQLEWKPEGAKVWQELPVTVREAGPGSITAGWTIPVEGAARVDLNALAHLPPSRLPRAKTRPIHIPRAAILRGALGVDPLGADLGLPPVRFRVAAHSGGASRVVLDDVVDAAATKWTDYDIDLTSFAGRSVRFAITATPLRLGLALPLVGATRLLAPSSAPRPWNVLLVSIDTLRADHLGTYGCELATSPGIDAFAKTGTVFEQAVAPYPATTASHMSLFTGLYPVVHDVRSAMRALSARIPTLTELLAARGYETLAVTEDGMVAAASGFSRGFVRYHEFKRPGPADTPGFIREGVSMALDWLARNGDVPWFLFLHSYVVHGPFTPPAEFNLFTTYRNDGHDVPIGPDTPQSIRDERLYAGEVRYMDAEITRLLQTLAERHELDRTLVVFLSDHGEAFDARHGFVGHGFTLADEVMHVPLILRAPGLVPAGLRVAAPVSLVDVLPTILDLLGASAAPDAQGRSLRPLLENPDAPQFAERLVFAETVLQRDVRQLAVRRGRHKWIVGKTPWSGDQVYDIAADPDEEHDLGADTALAAQGKALAAMYDANAQTALDRIEHARAQEAAPDPETVQKLRALGYIE